MSPEIIMKQLNRYEQKVQQEEVNLKQEIENVRQLRSKLSVEEERMLDAYREGIFSSSMLKEQMLKIQQKKDLYSDKERALTDKYQQMFSKKEISGFVDRFCGFIQKRLKQVSNDFEDKCYVLRQSVKKITIIDKKVIIRSFVPISYPAIPSNGSIAYTSSGQCERNATLEYELVATL